MRGYKTTVTVPGDHQVVVHLPDDFPAGEAEVEVIVTSRPVTSSMTEALAAFDRFLASLPEAPVVSLESLDRSSVSQ